MAFRLNESNIIRAVYEGIPASDIPHVVHALPTVYLGRLLRFVAYAAEETPRLEFNLVWIHSLLTSHGRYLKDNSGTFGPELRAVQRAVDDIHNSLNTLMDYNSYTLNYLLSRPMLAPEKARIVGFASSIAVANGDADGDDHMADAADDDDDDDGNGEWTGLEG